jgi:hypothetical protein
MPTQSYISPSLSLFLLYVHSNLTSHLLSPLQSPQVLDKRGVGAFVIGIDPVARARHGPRFLPWRRPWEVGRQREGRRA